MIATALLLAATHAHAGDLVIQVEPVSIYVDGRRVEMDPVTGRVKLRGLRGVHVVEVRDPSGVVLAHSEVRVPPRQNVRLVFDGAGMRPIAPPAPPPQPVGPEPMDGATFTLLMSEVSKLSFGDDKLGAIELAAARSWFTTDQVGQLIDQMSFGDDKIAVVKLTRTRIVDMDRAFTLASRFDFSNDAEEAMDLLRAVRTP
ncbi:MAG: DUF4476 domain-containing protein [Myxococcales bacterium]|nr:DUF4476 domain-containing protein [Myxococcales bacterium]